MYPPATVPYAQPRGLWLSYRERIDALDRSGRVWTGRPSHITD